MARTSVVLDKALVTKCLKATGLKTRRQLIDLALRELLRLKGQKKVLELEGAVHWEGDLEAWRRGRF